MSGFVSRARAARGARRGLLTLGGLGTRTPRCREERDVADGEIELGEGRERELKRDIAEGRRGAAAVGKLGVSDGSTRAEAANQSRRISYGIAYGNRRCRKCRSNRGTDFLDRQRLA